MDQKKKLIIGGVVAVVVVLGLIWLLSKPNILVAEEPKFNVEDLRNMAPEDGSVLAALQGYAKYLPAKYGNKQYLVLAPVTSIQVTKSDTLWDVKFDSQYGSLSMAVLVVRTSKYQIRNITIETHDGDTDKSCHVNDARISFEQDKHFECLRPLPVLSCVRRTKSKDGIEFEVRLAELTISAIRLEVDGNSTKHKEGKFTYDIKKCDGGI